MGRSTDGIQRREDGWYEAWQIEGRDAEGQPVYVKFCAESYAAVKRQLDAGTADAWLSGLGGREDQAERNGQAEFAPSQTVKAAVTAYLESVKGQIRPSTYSVYARHLSGHIAPFFSGIRCDGLTARTMQKFVDKLSADGMSESTVQGIWYFLKAALEESVSGEAFRVKLPKGDKRGVDYLSIEEQRRLEAAVSQSDDINRVGMMLCLYTGIRIGELCGLMWDDVDFDNGRIYIKRTAQRVPKAGVTARKGRTGMLVQPPQTAHSNRVIPLPEFLADTLTDYRREAIGEYVISRKGSPMDPRTVQNRFKKLLEDAEVRDVPFNALRDTFAVRALENGFDIATLSEILGHSSVTIATEKYGGFVSRGSMNRIERFSLAGN